MKKQTRRLTVVNSLFGSLMIIFFMSLLTGCGSLKVQAPDFKLELPSGGEKIEKGHYVAIYMNKLCVDPKVIDTDPTDFECDYTLVINGQRTNIAFEIAKRDGIQDVLKDKQPKLVYLGEYPGCLNIQYRLFESDEKVRAALDTADFVLEKFKPVASGAHPGAGAAVGAAAAIARFTESRIDDDDLDIVRFLHLGNLKASIPGKTFLEFKESSKDEASGGRVVIPNQTFTIYDLGKPDPVAAVSSKKDKTLESATGKEPKLALYSVRMNNVKYEKTDKYAYLAYPDYGWTTKDYFGVCLIRGPWYFANRAWDYFFDDKVTFNFGASSMDKSNMLSAQYENLRSTMIWKSQELFKVSAGTFNNNPMLPMSIEFSLCYKGLNTEHLVDAVAIGMNAFESEYTIANQTIKPKEYAEKLQKNKESIVKFVAEHTARSKKMMMFNGIVFLEINPQSNPIPKNNTKDQVLYLKKLAPNKWGDTFVRNNGGFQITFDLEVERVQDLD